MRRVRCVRVRGSKGRLRRAGQGWLRRRVQAVVGVLVDGGRVGRRGACAGIAPSLGVSPAESCERAQRLGRAREPLAEAMAHAVVLLGRLGLVVAAERRRGMEIDGALRRLRAVVRAGKGAGHVCVRLLRRRLGRRLLCGMLVVGAVEAHGPRVRFCNRRCGHVVGRETCGGDVGVLFSVFVFVVRRCVSIT